MRHINETQKQGKKPTAKKNGGMVSFSERQKERWGLKRLEHQRSALFLIIELSIKKKANGGVNA